MKELSLDDLVNGDTKFLDLIHRDTGWWLTTDLGYQWQVIGGQNQVHLISYYDEIVLLYDGVFSQETVEATLKEKFLWEGYDKPDEYGHVWGPISTENSDTWEWCTRCGSLRLDYNAAQIFHPGPKQLTMFQAGERRDCPGVEKCVE